MKREEKGELLATKNGRNFRGAPMIGRLFTPTRQFACVHPHVRVSNAWTRAHTRINVYLLKGGGCTQNPSRIWKGRERERERGKEGERQAK